MHRKLIPIAIVLIAIGCQSDSDRVAELASRHATQQAELSRETVKLHVVERATYARRVVDT